MQKAEGETQKKEAIPSKTKTSTEARFKGFGSSWSVGQAPRSSASLAWPKTGHEIPMPA